MFSGACLNDYTIAIHFVSACLDIKNPNALYALNDDIKVPVELFDKHSDVFCLDMIGKSATDKRAKMQHLIELYGNSEINNSAIKAFIAQ
jgi:hypothetical protein